MRVVDGAALVALLELEVGGNAAVVQSARVANLQDLLRARRDTARDCYGCKRSSDDNEENNEHLRLYT
jgi:hypothetical protein